MARIRESGGAEATLSRLRRDIARLEGRFAGAVAPMDAGFGGGRPRGMAGGARPGDARLGRSEVGQWRAGRWPGDPLGDLPGDLP